MKNENNRVSRRRFSLGVAMAPLALANLPAFGAEEIPSQGAAASVPENPPPAPKRRWQIYEEEHFTHPLTFQRSEVKPQVLPFALDEVDIIQPQQQAWRDLYDLDVPVVCQLLF